MIVLEVAVRVACEFQGRGCLGDELQLELELFDEYFFRRLGSRQTRRCWPTSPSLSSSGTTRTRDGCSEPTATIRFAAHRSAGRLPQDLLLRQREGVLLGSGNLTLRGIEEGHELFCPARLRATMTRADRGWRDWMDMTVDRAADREVTYRWLDLKQRAPWLDGPADGSRFVSNLQQSLLDQLAASLAAPVDELHVLAPYYDRQAKALRALLDRLRPRQLDVYLGAGTSVDGAALVRLLDQTDARVSVHSFEPNEFVHAKLIGDGWHEGPAQRLGRLLTGCAHRLIGHRGVGERRGWAADRNVTRRCPWCSPVAASNSARHLDRVAELEFEAEEEGPQAPLLLRAARLLKDERVELAVDGAIPAETLVTAGLEAQPLSGDRSDAPLALPEGCARVALRCERKSPVQLRCAR